MDLISRQAILKHIEKKRQDALMMDDLYESNIIMMGMKLLEEAVRNQPSAQPEKMQLSKEDATKGTTFDCISRKDAIDLLEEIETKRLQGKVDLLYAPMIKGLKKLPPAEPESRREWYMKGYRDAQDAAMHESCTDCPLYDHDRHNCPRFNKVIPETLREVMAERRQDENIPEGTL